MKILWPAILLLRNYVQPEKNVEQDIKKDLWIDPNDPTTWQSSPQKENIVSNHPKEKSCQILRLILRQFLHEIHVDYKIDGPITRDVKIQLPAHSMSVLSMYLKNAEADSPHDGEAVRSALSNIFQVQEAVPGPTWQETLQPFIFQLNLIILPAAAFVVVRSIVRPRNFWILVFTTILFFSMCSAYNKKYQEAEARKIAQFHESSRDACAPEGLFSRVAEIITSPFQFRQKSNCLKYIERQTVSILYEISIIEIFSETIANGFFSFMSASARHFNHFFRDLYDGTPLLAQIVITFFLILMTGTIRTPFFSYEPIWLSFCSSSIGKIFGWLEGIESVALPPTPLNIIPKEVKILNQKEKVEMIEYPKSERESEESGSENGKMKKKTEGSDSTKKAESLACVDSLIEDDLNMQLESGEGEELLENKNTSSLSESSYS